MKKIRLLLALGLMVLGAMMNSVSAQEIGAWKGFKSGAATFTFLQNAPCHVTYVAPLFDSYGYEASFYLTTSTVTNWSDWQTVADNGHEIGSYGMTNTASINESELIQSKSIINSHITGQNCITLCYPNCQRPENTGWMSNYFIAGSDCRNRVMDGSNLGMEDPYLIPKIMTGEMGINSTAQIASKMQEAINSKGWAVFMTCGIQGQENGNATYSPTSSDALRGALQWADENGKIWVSSLRNVEMYACERFQSTFALQSETTTAATYTLTHSMNTTVCDYDYPLSLRVPLQGWTDIEVKQNGNVIEHTVNGDYIYFDAVPNGGTIVISHAPAAFKEIYAAMDGTKMVLYYDDQKASRSGVLTDWTPEEGVDMDDATRETITKAVISPSMVDARPTGTKWWFFNLANLTTIEGLAYLNTSEVTDMESMFMRCSSLSSLDVSNFNTAKVTDMRAMFMYCSSLTSLDLSNFNTDNVTDMHAMFQVCSSLTSLNVSSFKTANVTDMGAMFSGCPLLTSLDLSSFNTANVTNMASMFNFCSSLSSLDLSSFNTDKVTSMSFMFDGCSSLTELDVSSFNTDNVTTMNRMFSNCSALKTIYCDDDWSTSSVLEESQNMFDGCTALVGGKGTAYNSSIVDATYARPDKGASEPGYFTNKETEPKIYAAMDGTKMVLYYDDQKESRANVIAGWKPTSGAYNMTAEEKEAVTSIELDASMQDALPTSTYRWFHVLENVTSIIHLDYLNTSAVTNMNGMFVGCKSLTSLDVSGFNTTNVTNMGAMFATCSSLTTLDLSSFNTSKVTNLSSMFANCHMLTNLDISSFNTASATDLGYMFASCSSLTTLDLNHFNTSKTEDMAYMFKECKSLTTIKCNNDWSASSVLEDSENMFDGCTSLVGGKGTAYDAAHKDATYARPDKTGQAGYFTLSPEKAVEDLIDAIGEVEYTAESKAKIDEARAGYDALTKAQKEKVSNYDVLKAAEALYLALKMEAEYADVIAEVEGECEYQINLVTPGTFAIAMVEAMGDHTWVDVHHLCVSGPMNDDDLSYLAQCVNMVTLSLRNAQFEEYGASNNWKSLEKILLPPTCKTLKKEAFYRCEKLSYINLGEVETFGEQAFMYCERLPEVDLHSAKTLDHRVFEYCKALTSVNMPEATYIGTQCFVGCSNLVSASMPKATTIGANAFGYLTKLTHVELCDDIERFEGSAFYDCKALLSVKLPSKLRYIGSSTFTDIIEVEGEWPKGIEYIGSGNFKNLNYMVIGPNVTQMWVASNKWQNIYCYAADPQAVVSKYNPFTASNVGNATLYVPRSSLSAYKLNQAYANFLHIYALDDDIDLLHIHSPYMMLSTDRITDDAQLILHPDAALKTSAPSPLKVGSYEQYIHLGPKQYTSQTVTEDGVQVTHYYSYLHHTGILHANSPLSSDEVTVHLIPMHKQWNFITLPFDVSVQDISIWARGTGSKENGTPGVSQYVFREYSGANRASGSGATWVNVPEDGVLQANKGYILYWAVEGGTSQTNYYPGTLSDEFIYYFRMPAMHTENHSNIFATGDVQVPLTHYSSEFPQNVSWNLVGNPYPCMYDIRQTDFDATMTMWNGTAYVAYSPIDDPYTLRPGEAFFVQAPDEVDAITFHEEGRYDATKIEIDQNAYQLHMMPTHTRVAGGRTLYNFLLSDSAYSDRARLVINASASEAYDLHRDAAKMLSTDAGVPQLWIEEDGVRYAINECQAQDSYRMGAFIASDGEYRITLVSDDAANTIWLTDLHTNTVTNLSQGAYTFTAEAGMHAGRFLITFRANAPTRVENGEDGAMQGTKLLIDGQLIIITPQGKRFNANGVEL